MVERRLRAPLHAGEGLFEVYTSRPITEDEWVMIVECLFLSKPGFVDDAAESTSFRDDWQRVPVSVLGADTPATKEDANE